MFKCFPGLLSVWGARATAQSQTEMDLINYSI